VIRLLSYNVLEGATPGRLSAVLRVVKSARADAVALQEARYWRRNRREIFREVSRRLRMRGILAHANSGFDLAVFTRLPLLGSRNYGRNTAWLHTAVSVDLRCPSGETLALFNVHLRPDMPGRREEARLLREWLRDYRDRYCAVCGDFNSLTTGDPLARQLLWPGSQLERPPAGIISAIRREGWRDCFRLRNPRLPGYTLGAGRRVARVDYIFASKPLARRLHACRVHRHPDLRAASDHSPIWADFDL
jgi:exodeoxyribonuclease-3